MPTNNNYTSRYLNLYSGRLLPSFIRPNPTTELTNAQEKKAIQLFRTSFTCKSAPLKVIQMK